MTCEAWRHGEKITTVSGEAHDDAGQLGGCRVLLLTDAMATRIVHSGVVA